jgi:hypothetical protein
MGRCDAVGGNFRRQIIWNGFAKNCINVQELNIYTVKQTAWGAVCFRRRYFYYGV